MPAGYATRCKACNSPHRLKIEYWHEKDGLSNRAIQAKLKAEFGEDISSVAIGNHLVEHYNVQADAREKYYQSQGQIEKDASGRLTDLQILDELIQDNHIIHTGLRAQLKDLSNKLSVPLPAVQMLNGVSAEICRAIKTKQEILGEDPGSRGAETFLELIRLAESDDNV